MTEEQLVRQCKKGDGKAQKLLFDGFADRFFRMSLRYVRDAAEAEDVVMQAFVKILKHMPGFTYKDPRSLEAWMYQIVVNEALMALRRKYNFRLTESLDADNPDHESEVFQDADAGYLYQLILELPDGYRTVFNLHAIEGYDHAEIGEMLGISESTSRSQLFKAKQLLRKKINREGFHYGT